MGRGILIRITGKLIFHDKIQQSGINITRLRTSGGRSNESANKIIIIGIKKSHNLVFSWDIVTTQARSHANKRSNEKKGKRKEGK